MNGYFSKKINKLPKAHEKILNVTDWHINNHRNASHNEISPHTYPLKKNLEKERKKRTSKGVEKLEPLYMGLVEMLNGVTTMENSKEFPQKIKNIITI